LPPRPSTFLKNNGLDFRAQGSGAEIGILH
jgi:hypothetical protein